MTATANEHRKLLVQQYKGLYEAFHNAIEEGKDFNEAKKIFRELKLIWIQLMDIYKKEIIHPGGPGTHDSLNEQDIEYEAVPPTS